jgi:hypothetical protein
MPPKVSVFGSIMSKKKKMQRHVKPVIIPISLARQWFSGFLVFWPTGRFFKFLYWTDTPICFPYVRRVFHRSSLGPPKYVLCMFSICWQGFLQDSCTGRPEKR